MTDEDHQFLISLGLTDKSLRMYALGAMPSRHMTAEKVFSADCGEYREWQGIIHGLIVAQNALNSPCEPPGGGELDEAVETLETLLCSFEFDCKHSPNQTTRDTWVSNAAAVNLARTVINKYKKGT